MINLEELRKTLEGSGDGAWTFDDTFGIVDSRSWQVAECVAPQDGPLIVQAPALAAFTLEVVEVLKDHAKAVEKALSDMAISDEYTWAFSDMAREVRALLQDIEGGE